MAENKPASKGFAITALIMGIVAIVNSFIPILNIASYVFAILAIVFGIIGIVKKGGKAMAIVGLVLGGVSLISATAINAGTSSLINEALEEAGLTETKTTTVPTTTTRTTTTTTKSTTSKKTKYGLGDTFVFDELEFTLDSEYSFVTLDNQFSDLNGRDVIKLGVTVKNLSDDNNHLNMFYYDVFGSEGVELQKVTAYFDDAIDYAGDLRPGASYKTYFYILYDGNGTYGIDFDNYSQKVNVEFNITK